MIEYSAFALKIDPFEGMCCGKLRSVIWKLFEDPNSSSAAKVTATVVRFDNLQI